MMKFDVENFPQMKAALAEICARLKSEQYSEDQVFEVKLVACELISNVLQHDGGRARCLVNVNNEIIRLAVKGENGFCPPEKSCCSDVESTFGRGLFLIDELASRRTFSEEEGVVVVIQKGEEE